jgi:hypothetical protein
MTQARDHRPTVLAHACRTGIKAPRVEAPSSWHGGNGPNIITYLGRAPVLLLIGRPRRGGHSDQVRGTLHPVVPAPPFRRSMRPPRTT